MNISFEKIMTWAQGLTRPKGVLHTRLIATPVRDWKIMLLSGAIGILLCGLLSFFVYLGAHEKVLPDDVGGPATLHSKVKEAEIKSALSAFALRAQVHAEYQTKRIGLVDPSL